MAILMLCDTPVYDIANDTVLNKHLCPFIHAKDTRSAYEIWYSHRAYLKTNRTAERVVSQLGGENTFEAKRRLSLSDSFWIKYEYDKETKFDEITPYNNPFSLLEVKPGIARSSAVPELVLGGSQPKQWGRSQEGTTYMTKAEQSGQIHAEMLAVQLALKSGLKTMNAFVQTEKGKLYAKDYRKSFDYSNLGLINIINITNTKRSMIQFDQLGIGVNGYDINNVVAAYIKAGVTEDIENITLTQILFDCVIGNIDRKNNNSNWAVFMDHDNGKRRPSWLYDFNWANLTTEAVEMMEEVIHGVKKARLEQRAIQYLLPIITACSLLGLELWHGNAQKLLKAFQVQAV